MKTFVMLGCAALALAATPAMAQDSSYKPGTVWEAGRIDVLPGQFDEYVWFDRTCAVTPLDSSELKGAPDTYPFGI